MAELYLIYVLIIFIIYILAMLMVVMFLAGEWFGAPYLPTSQKILQEIFEYAKLKSGQQMIELGSGDGRVLRFAVKKYGVSGVGVEIHPGLVWWSRLMAKLEGVKNIQFLQKNMYSVDLSEYQVVYLFLLAKTLKKLGDTSLKRCKKDTLVIAHGFKIDGWEEHLVGQQNRKMFSTYFYRV